MPRKPATTFAVINAADMAEMQHQRSDQRIGLDRRAKRHDPHVCEHAIKDLREEECDQHDVAE